MSIVSAIRFAGKVYGAAATGMAMYEFINKNNKTINSVIGKTILKSKDISKKISYDIRFNRIRHFLTDKFTISIENGTIVAGFRGFKSELTREVFEECLKVMSNLVSQTGIDGKEIYTNIDLIEEAMKNNEGISPDRYQRFSVTSDEVVYDDSMFIAR